MICVCCIQQQFMSILIRQEGDSSASRSSQSYDLYGVLLKVASQVYVLRSAQSVLSPQANSQIQNKYQQMLSSDDNLAGFLEYLLYSMLNQLDQLRQTATINVSQEDYQVLQQSMQKSQAEVRKHIRIEQQLKIYMDGLQQKLQEMEKKMAVQQQKYNKLFEVDEERQELLRRLNRMEASGEKSRQTSQYATISDQLQKDYLVVRKPRNHSRSKQLIEKSNQRRKMSDKKSNNLHNKNTKFVQGAIHINLSNNIVVSKKSSYDHNMVKNNAPSHQSSIKELTKTVIAKQQQLHAPQYDRRPIFKLAKYKTQTSEYPDKRENRSSSVCN